MNLGRFIDLLTPDVRWWICKIMHEILHNNTLIDPNQHALYLNIALNHKEHMLPFLDAAIVLRCLEEKVVDKNHLAFNDVTNLMHFIKEHLEEENYVTPPTVGKHSGNDPMLHMHYEKYEEPRIFLDDPVKKGIRMKYVGGIVTP